MSKELSLILSKIYAWIGLGIMLLFTIETPQDNWLAMAKFVIILAQLYDKVAWRMFVLILCVWSIIYGLMTMTNVWSLVDVAGFLMISYYLVKYTK